MPWDHPRMRGEHWIAMKPAESPVGSSPHARGAPCAHDRISETLGIIPACAGSTSVLTPPLSTLGEDHPRMRGEHRGWPLLHGIKPGSSPHARGALPKSRGD